MEPKLTSEDIFKEMVFLTGKIGEAALVVQPEVHAYCMTIAINSMRIQYGLVRIAEAIEGLNK